MAKSKKTRGQIEHARRTRAVKNAGFRSYHEYRKALAIPSVRRVLRAAGIPKGWARYQIVGLAANVQTLPGSPGETGRQKYAGILSDAIRAAGKDPSKFWGALGSPKKPLTRK